MEDRIPSPPVDMDGVEYDFSQVADRPFQDWTDVSFYPHLEDASPGVHYWTADLPFLQLSASLSEHGKPSSSLKPILILTMFFLNFRSLSYFHALVLRGEF